MTDEAGSASRWPWFVGALIIAGYAGLYRVRTFDTFFHLATGRWIVEHGAVPTEDPFSFSFPGAPWHDHSWGFQWALWQLHRLAGVEGLSVLVALSCAALLALGTARLAPRRPYLLPWALLPFALFRDGLCPRPHLVGMLALSSGLVLLDAASRRERPALLWATVPIHAAWVTAHGSHLMWLPLLAGAGAVQLSFARWTTGSLDAAQRRWLGHLAGVVAAGLAFTALLAPDAITNGLEHVGSETLRRYVPEWKPLTPRDLITTWQAPIALLAIVGALAGIPLSWRERADDRAARAALAGRVAVLLVLTALALTSVRMLGLWLFGAMPLWIEQLDATSRAIARRVTPSLAEPRAQHGMVAITMFLVGLQVVAAGKTFVPGVGLDERRYPVGAVWYLRNHPELSVERLFHAYRYGGYLMYARPEAPVLIDGRAITVYPPAFMARFVGVYDVPARFEDFAEEYGIQGVLLPTGSRRTGALRWRLDQDQKWKAVYRDPHCELWVATYVIDRAAADRQVPEISDSYNGLPSL